MSALDAERQIADGNLVGGDRVNIDAEPLAAHAERIADAVMVVEVIAGGQRVQHHALVAGGILPGAGDDAERIVLAHRACGKRHARREALALQPAAGHGDTGLLDDDAGHALGGVHGGADAMLGAVEMGDHAAFEAFGAVMAEAEHLELNSVAGDFEPVGRRPGSRDQAADLARANVERGHDALALATIET